LAAPTGPPLVIVRLNYNDQGLIHTKIVIMTETFPCNMGNMSYCLQCGTCACNCEADAINFEDTSQDVEYNVSSIIVATGFDGEAMFFSDLSTTRHPYYTTHNQGSLLQVQDSKENIQRLGNPLNRKV